MAGREARAVAARAEGKKERRAGLDRLQHFDGLGNQNLLLDYSVAVTIPREHGQGLVAHSVEALDQTDSRAYCIGVPFGEVFAVVQTASRVGDDLGTGLVEHTESAVAPVRRAGGILLVPGQLEAGIALGRAGVLTVQTALVEDQIPTGPSVEASLPLPVASDSPSVEHLTDRVIDLGDVQEIEGKVELFFGQSQAMDLDAVGVARRVVPAIHGVVARVPPQECGHCCAGAHIDLLMELFHGITSIGSDDAGTLSPHPW